jgi:hypothetical protein
VPRRLRWHRQQLLLLLLLLLVRLLLLLLLVLLLLLLLLVLLLLLLLLLLRASPVPLLNLVSLENSGSPPMADTYVPCTPDKAHNDNPQRARMPSPDQATPADCFDNTRGARCALIVTGTCSSVACAA